jgi:tocopherol cyclase
LIYSIEDPQGTGQFSGVGAQVMGPDDGYVLQYSKDVSSFWADRSSLALGATFDRAAPSSASREAVATEPDTLMGFKKPEAVGVLSSSLTAGIVSEERFNASVLHGFQASARWHQGSIVDRQAGASGDLKSTVSSCRWAFSVRPILGWGDSNGQQRATAGWLASLPVFEPHWQVLMAHGEGSGWIEWGGQKYSFSNAPVYAEKNWGGGFPSRWAWIQCNSFKDSPGTSVTAVGARRSLLNLPMMGTAPIEDVGLIGIHHEGQFYELNVKDSIVHWDVDPWGTWSFSASSSKYHAVLEATCRCPGTPLRAPTAESGLAPFCRDSFAGEARLRVWTVHQKGGESVRGKLLFDCWSQGKSAAVEVGGGPWWQSWSTDAEMAPAVKALLNMPIDVESIFESVPPQLRPPGL